jgi:hypothetical protein
MSEKLKTQPPARAAFDSQFAKEESRVRSRSAENTPVPDSRPYLSGRGDGGVPSNRGTEMVSERSDRIAQKIGVANLVLERLRATDSRARLLASAVLRRDEVLLDAVLSQMTEEVLGIVSQTRSPKSR